MTGDASARVAAGAARVAGGAAGAAAQAPSEEELAAVLAALRGGGASGEPDEDPFTAWRRRRLSALGVRISSPGPPNPR
jgi:hypothetical protein